MSFGSASESDTHKSAAAEHRNPIQSAQEAVTASHTAPALGTGNVDQAFLASQKLDWQALHGQPPHADEASSADDAQAKMVDSQKTGSHAQTDTTSLQPAASDTHAEGDDNNIVAASRGGRSIVAAPTTEPLADVCSLLLVAGSHLGRWLSTVKLVSSTLPHA